MHNYFAGPIFTPGQELMIDAIIFIAVAVVAGIIAYAAWALYRRFKPNPKAHKPKLTTGLLIGVGIAGAITLAIAGKSAFDQFGWENKQQACAEEVGYESPADDETPGKATAESQQKYWACLDR